MCISKRTLVCVFTLFDALLIILLNRSQIKGVFFLILNNIISLLERGCLKLSEYSNN